MIKLNLNNPDKENDYFKLVVGIRRGPFLPPMLMLYDSLDQALYDFGSLVHREVDIEHKSESGLEYRMCVYGALNSANCFFQFTNSDDEKFEFETDIKSIIDPIYFNGDFFGEMYVEGKLNV